MLSNLEFISVFYWCIVPVILGIFWLLSWKNSKKYKGMQTIPTVSMIPVCTILLIRLRQGYKLKDMSDFFLPLCFGLAHLHYKEKVIKFAWAGREFLYCFGLNSAEIVFRSTTNLDKEKAYKSVEPVLASGIFLSGGNKWKTRRKMLTPAFHFQILRDFLLIFNDHSNALVETLNKLDGNVSSITRILQLCTLNIIIESAMGLKMNVKNKECSEFIQAIKRSGSHLLNRFVKPWYWMDFIYNFSSAGKRMKKNTQICKTFTGKIIQMRRARLLEEGETRDIIDDFQTDRDDLGTKKRRILLDLLLYYHLTDSTFTEEDIREEVITFIVAGYTTSGMVITWILYLLGWNETVQENVYRELKFIFGEEPDRAVTADDVREMKYMECVIKETQRLYPVIPIIGRCSSEDIETEGYTIPTNTSILISLYSIHHDPNIYPDPEKFDPDRFLPENCSKRHPYAYVPFSAGPRNCIGQRFAMMEMKTILAYILRNFKVRSLDHRDKLCFAGDVFLHPKKPIRLKLEKR